MKKRFTLLLTVIFVLIIGIVAFGAVYNDRINILVFGVEGTRTDTMILVSIETSTNQISAVSIPRDTYFPTEGHSKLGQKKLNARYGFKDNGGVEGLTDAIQTLLGIKIDHYIKVDYDSVAAIVDLLGGVEVDVPFSMKYDDPYATPPLHIDFEPGVQTISGEKAMGYLRFRKSNDGKVREGDIQRIERQQQFLKSTAKEALTLKLPLIASRALSYVDSDLSTKDVLLYTSAMLGTNMDKVHMYTLPMKSVGTGDDGLSYFFHDSDATHELLVGIFDGSLIKAEEAARALAETEAVKTEDQTN